jgi:acetyl esterase
MLAAAVMSAVSRLGVQEMREGFVRLARMVDVKNVPIGRVEAGELNGVAHALPIRIYTPIDTESKKLAGFVYFHGGGGVFGSLDTHDGLCRMLANESGCRLISVAYRLAPESTFPAAIEDGYAATKWVADRALELGIDPVRIAVGGDSAGANLAAVTCHMAKQQADPRLALQVLFCPVTDMSAETDSHIAFAEGYFLNKETLDWVRKHYCSPEADLRDPRISPLRAVDFGGLPPAHIHTAEFDPLRDEGKAYSEALKGAGVHVEFTCHQGMIHHFYCMGGAIPYARTAIKAAGMAIKRALAEVD